MKRERDFNGHGDAPPVVTAPRLCDECGKLAASPIHDETRWADESGDGHPFVQEEILPEHPRVFVQSVTVDPKEPGVARVKFEKRPTEPEPKRKQGRPSKPRCAECEQRPIDHCDKAESHTGCRRRHHKFTLTKWMPVTLADGTQAIGGEEFEISPPVAPKETFIERIVGKRESEPVTLEPKTAPVRTESLITEAVVKAIHSIDVASRKVMRRLEVQPTYAVDDDGDLLAAEVSVKFSLVFGRNGRAN